MPDDLKLAINDYLPLRDVVFITLRQAILKGEFLLRLNIGRYFVHIAYTCLLFGLVIWFSLMIETTMSKVEKNKAVLKELEIVHSQKVFEVVGVSRRASVEQMLGEMGSKVKEAEKPATTVRK